MGEEALDAGLKTLREIGVDRFREFNEEAVAVIGNLQLAFATNRDEKFVRMTSELARTYAGGHSA